MKKIYTCLMALAALLTANAQAPDPSTWEEGQNVVADLGMGDYDGSFSGEAGKSNGDYWKGSTPTEWEENDGIGVTGFYRDGNAGDELANIYQVLYFPAGSYTIKVQALYREGTPADTYASWFKGNQRKYAWLYASVLKGADIESGVANEFTQVLRSLADSEQTGERLFFDSDGSWKNDAEGKTTVDGVEVKYYCPCCLAGASAHFKAGHYENELNIILTEGAYVRLGLRKTGNIVQDWMVFSNWRIIYNGEADEAAQIEFASQKYLAAQEAFEAIKDKFYDLGLDGMGEQMSDLLITYDEEMDQTGSINDGAEKLKAVTDLVKKIQDSADFYNSMLQYVSNFADIRKRSEWMMNNTEYPGLDAFKAAYDNINDRANNVSPADFETQTPAEFFSGLFNELSVARATYLDSQEKDENGAKDFTPLITNPWFVNLEFTPVKVTGKTHVVWEINEQWKRDEMIAKGETPPSHTWAHGDAQGQGNYADKKADRFDVASDVEVGNDATIENQWYKYQALQGWSPGYNLYYQSGLIGVSDGWNASQASGSNSALDGSIGVRQQLAGLPDGYYSLKALLRGNGEASWDMTGKKHNIFAQNSEGAVVSSPVGHPDKYYPNSAQWGFGEWNNDAWVEHSTGIIHVPDGKLLIGGETGLVGNFTGFRLFFYGTEPMFDSMMDEEIAKINESAEKLTFAGDKKFVAGQIAKCVKPVADAAMYETYIGYLDEAREYMNKALQKKYTATETYQKLIDDNANNQTIVDMVTPALEASKLLGTGEDDTYELIDPANATANKYADYIAKFKEALEFTSTETLRNEQAGKLASGIQEETTIQQYILNLTPAITIARMEDCNADKATEDRPANVTFLLKNPSFAEGAKTGWTCGEDASRNIYGNPGIAGDGVSELWNKSAFTFSQKLVGLPGGTYELRVKAVYRDGGSVTKDLVEAYDAAGGEENWANHNAELFAKASDENDKFTYIKAVQSLKATEPSFVEGHFEPNEWENGDEENGAVIGYKWNLDINVAGLQEWNNGGTLDNGSTYEKPKSPFDTAIEWTEVVTDGAGNPVQDVDGEGNPAVDGEGNPIYKTQVAKRLYYPCSMYGFYSCLQKYPGVYDNKVRITIEPGETLEVGIRKTKKIDSDWVIMDDFELYYLSGDAFQQTITGIANVDAQENNANDAIFNVAGQRVSDSYKGIVIRNGKKFMQR